MRAAFIAVCWILQWGRGLVTAESQTTNGANKALDSTSMGPRSCDRGELELVADVHGEAADFNGAAVL